MTKASLVLAIPKLDFEAFMRTLHCLNADGIIPIYLFSLFESDTYATFEALCHCALHPGPVTIRT